jgi:hypothetical protein
MLNDDLRLDNRLNAIAWPTFGTAYGPAIKVPDQLRRLAGSDKKDALRASHELWCGLCHQHAQVGSAALPALPFLLEVLDRGDRDLTVNLLDMLVGFALGCNRKLEAVYWHSEGKTVPPEPEWQMKLRDALNAELPRFLQLATSSDKEIEEFAKWIVTELEENHEQSTEDYSI